jgi:prolyl-tRNA editing enzyme YbaK/EbsC (Cys-tRNA(Pro) deacylase)
VPPRAQGTSSRRSEPAGGGKRVGACGSGHAGRGTTAADARLPAVPEPTCEPEPAAAPELAAADLPLRDPAVRRVAEAAALKGIDLHIVVLDATTHTAEDAARALGVELGQIVKSLVFVAPHPETGHEPILCLVSGANRVDVARLAAVVGEPAIRRATAREARDLTGFAIGGIPPVGHANPVRVVMDPDLGRHREVWAAAGVDRAVFPVAPAALRALTNAIVAPIAVEQDSAPTPTAAEQDAAGIGSASSAPAPAAPDA